MPDFKQNYFQRRTKHKGPRSNNRIVSAEVQVISSDGQNLGILNTQDAITIAKNEGLDLIEIAQNAKPPVCKIMDRGKYKYDAQKKANKAKKKQKKIEIKEIKLRPVTEIHDYLRLLYARIGKPFCYKCGDLISKQTLQQIVDSVLSNDIGTKLQILALHDKS